MGLPPSRDSRTANSRLRSWRNRAIRYRNLARSLPRMARQSLSKASRAAATAASTSSAPASATSASFSSFDGSIVSKYRPDSASTNLPPMNNPYRSLIETNSRDSGAGAYSQAGTLSGVRSSRRSISDTFSPWSVDSGVIGALVGAGPLLLDLHQHIVQERGRSDPEQVLGHPVGTQCLVQQDQVLDGLLGLADSTGHLDPYPSPGLVIEIAGRFHHAQRRGERRSRRELPRGALDEVAAGRHRQDRGASDLIVGAELGHFQDRLQVGIPAGFLRRRDLLEGLAVPAGQERRAIQDDVDLVRSHGHRVPDLRQTTLEGSQAAGEGAGHAGHVYPCFLQPAHGYGNELRVETHRGHGRGRGVGRIGVNGLCAHGHDLARGVLALQRRQVHAADRQVERPQLRVALDRTLRQRRSPLLQDNSVDSSGS